MNIVLTTNQQKWLNHYNKLCNRGKERGLNKKKLDYYTERHHIIPRCMDGSDEKDNLVLLTAREHYVAHQLLVKIYPNNYKLIYAVKVMHLSNSKIIRNNREYEWIKKNFSKIHSQTLTGRTKETHPGVAKQSQKLKGRTKENNVSIALRADNLRGRSASTHEGIAIRAEKIRGRTKETHESIKAQAEKMRGRTKETHEGLAKMSKKVSKQLKGRTKETDLGVLQRALQQRKLNDEQEHEIYNLRLIGLTAPKIKKLFQEKYNITISISSISRFFLKIKNKNEL
jgi:hypothetical protein